MANDKLITIDELLVRYSLFSLSPGEPISKRTLYNWRKDKGFPEPSISKPRLVWKKIDVEEWEKENGYDYL